MPRLLLFLAGLAIVAGNGRAAVACSIPVFRYALEHWSPDAYVVRVFHSGPLSEDEAQCLEQLKTAGEDGSGNIRVDLFDLETELEAPVRQLWESRGSPDLPHMLLQSPAGLAAGLAAGQVVWEAALTAENVERIRRSPLRRQIAKELLAGESVVWVLLEAGDATADDAAWWMLTTELSRLETTLKLPPIDPADAAELAITPESLKLSFPAHRLSRSDSAEAAFVEMLLSVEPDLRDESLRGQPMAFPLFGRGRTLYALVGAGINVGTLDAACRFLTNGCQCTVKRDNPGVDLLFDVAWSDLVVPTAPARKILPPLVGLSGFDVESPDAQRTADLANSVSPIASIATGSAAADQPGPSEGQGDRAPLAAPPAAAPPATAPKSRWISLSPIELTIIVLVLAAGAVATGLSRRE